VTDLSFDSLGWLNLLWVVLAVVAAGIYGIWRRRVGLRRFADPHLLPRLVPGAGLGRPLLRLSLVATALLVLVGALIGPRWGQETQMLLRRNVDVLVLLDVSRSMLARDLAPSRLERAKLAIRDDLLPALGGDRIGLIVFAGVPALACPLTCDYGFFRLALDDVGPQSVGRGGTLIGDAIRKAGTLLAEDKLDTHKIVILITDGEDHESYPVEAAASLWEDQRVPIIALALGDPEQGARIPVKTDRGETYLEHAGQVVRSKADFATLQRVAGVSGQGVFVPVGTSNFDLASIYRQVVSKLRSTEEGQQQRVRQPARSHAFCVVALVLVLFESVLRDSPRRGGAHVVLAQRLTGEAA